MERSPIVWKVGRKKVTVGHEGLKAVTRTERYQNFQCNSVTDDIKRIYDAELKLKDEAKIVHKRLFEENFKKKDSLKQKNLRHGN